MIFGVLQPALVALVLLACRVGATGPACSSGKRCPHIFMVVIDDLGWNNVPWHNPDLEAAMPVSLNLTREGVELDRQYAYMYCSPTRSSLLSGRFPYHVNQLNQGVDFPQGGIDARMATIPRKLKELGFAAHAVGKWNCGAATKAHIPHGRGFDTHLGFFAGSQDHYTQLECHDLLCNMPNDGTIPSFNMVDLWLTDKPAYGMNGTYGDDMYTDFVLKQIEAHPVEKPMFYYVALQNNHEPLQAPAEYLEMFPEDWHVDRRAYAAMGAHWDHSLGRIVESLKERDMWKDTVMVVTADNGGPVYPTLSRKFKHCGGANNYPLLGGKTLNTEGGVRVASFVSGGFLPASARGRKVDGFIHVADWLGTFVTLAGGDVRDEPAEKLGLPGFDSVDVWPLVIGTTDKGREEIPLAIDGTGENVEKSNISALIVGDYKLLAGDYLVAIRQEPAWPSKGACCGVLCWESQAKLRCGTTDQPRCLFNIRRDPEEMRNLIDEEPEVAAQMTTRLQELRKDVYDPHSSDAADPAARAFWQSVYGGWKGPWMESGAAQVVV